MTMAQLNNYDKLARYYALVSKIIFGNTLIKAQKILLPLLKSRQRILIVGGGNGEILSAIDQLGKQDINIHYVEASTKMIALAQQRIFSNIQVHFVHNRIENLTYSKEFDVVFTPFFLDNFEKEKVVAIWTALDSYLINNGYWLYVDFYQDSQKPQLWKSAFLKLMYLFFKVTCNIETDHLYNPQTLFTKNYTILETHFHFHQFILSRCYQKNGACRSLL